MRRNLLVVTLITLSHLSHANTNPTTGNDLSIKMFKSLAKATETDNFVFSPYAIRTGLGMTALGAKGKTQKQLGKAPDLGQAKKDPSYKLLIANRLWVQYGFPLIEGYNDTSEKLFGDHPWMVDFTKAPDFLKDRVNGWVQEKTVGKIRDFMNEDSVDPTSKMLLTIGIYFKGIWSSPFQRNATQVDDFEPSEGDTLKAQFIRKRGSYNYFKNDEIIAIDIPYLDGEISTVMILPRGDRNFKKIEQALHSEDIDKWVSEFQLKEVDVKIPKFEFESSFELTEVLKGIGIQDAFSPEEADFSGMTRNKGLFISRTIHKTSFGLTEEGTEATSINIEGAARTLASVTPEAFHANRPFVFLVRHRATNSILFMGHIQKPTTKPEPQEGT